MQSPTGDVTPRLAGLSPAPAATGAFWATSMDAPELVTLLDISTSQFVTAGAYDPDGVSSIGRSAQMSEEAVWEVHPISGGKFRFRAICLTREATSAVHWTSGVTWWLSKCHQLVNWDASVEVIDVESKGAGEFW